MLTVGHAVVYNAVVCQLGSSDKFIPLLQHVPVPMLLLSAWRRYAWPGCWSPWCTLLHLLESFNPSLLGLPVHVTAAALSLVLLFVLVGNLVQDIHTH